MESSKKRRKEQKERTHYIRAILFSIYRYCVARRLIVPLCLCAVVGRNVATRTIGGGSGCRIEKGRQWVHYGWVEWRGDGVPFLLPFCRVYFTSSALFIYYSESNETDGERHEMKAQIERNKKKTKIVRPIRTVTNL